MHDEIVSYTSLRFFTRSVPSLSAEDTLQRFLRVSAQSGCTSLPILLENRAIGSLDQRTVQQQLESNPGEEMSTILLQPIGSILAPVRVTVPTNASLSEACALFRREKMGLTEALPVVDGQGYCVGMIVHQDLLIRPTDESFARPNRIGGMATPFGVYLTDGTFQGGASNLALVATGVATGLLLMVAGEIAQIGWQTLGHRLGMTNQMANLDISEFTTALPVQVALVACLLKLIVYLVFFGLLRITSIAGYHAAEHQTVHAMERNEPLVIEVVRRMPRPHPRCGTNLMGAALLVFTISPLLASLLHLASEDSLVLAILISFFCYRPFGTFLQQVFTTRPATDKQIASGIAAATALTATYYRCPPARSHWLRRIWCMGFIQNMVGLLLVAGAQALVLWGFDRWSHH